MTLHTFITSSIITISFLCITNLTQLNAHETWAEQVYLIKFGEPDEHDLESYHPDKISLLSAIDQTGRDLPIKQKAIAEASVIVEPQSSKKPAAIFYTIAYDPYIIKGKEWIKSTIEQAAKAEKSWNGSYTSTSILEWSDSLTKPRNRLIELVPQIDPKSLPIKQNLPIIIYKEGIPVEGAEVYLGKDNKIKSDKDGKINIPLKEGHQVIIASLNEKKQGHTTFIGAALSFTR